MVEYIHENCFNAYLQEENGVLTTIIMNAEVEMNPYMKDDLIVRTEHETYKVDYYVDSNEDIFQLDYEGHPITIVSQVYQAMLITLVVQSIFDTYL